MKTTIDDYLTTKEAAKKLKLTHQTTQKYCQSRNGKPPLLKCIRKGRLLLIPKEEVVRYNRERNPVGWPKDLKSRKN